MKKILAVGSLMLALHGHAQSYMILGNGVTLTTDKAAFVYDFGNFILPYSVTISGGQFFATDGKLVSIDEKGFLYRKDEKAPTKIKGKGNNYVIAENGTIYTFDATGFFYKYDKESATKKANRFGGNFFTVKPEDKKPVVDLYTLNSTGNYFKMAVPGLNPAEIAVTGGNFFQTSNGIVYTIGKDGIVYAKPDVKVGTLKKIGGNFFVDSNNVIFTVSDAGFLIIPALPANLVVANISKLGQNYFIDIAGNLFGVDATGVISSRTTNHNLSDTKVLSL